MEEEIHLSCDRCPHVSGGRRIPFHQKQHLGLRSPVKETLLLTYLKPKFCLDSSPSTQNLSFFVSQFLTNVLFLFLTSIKAAGFGHFLGPIYTWPPYAWIKMCLYLLLICFLFILLLVQPQNSRGVEGKNFPSLTIEISLILLIAIIQGHKWCLRSGKIFVIWQYRIISD